MESVDPGVDATPGQPLLAVEHLSKRFPGLLALSDVAFTVGAGEIVALVGQNGSGKSTLVKVLTGIHEPDPGAQVQLRAPVHVIHQDLGVVAQLNTIENLDLARGHRLSGMLPFNRGAEIRRAQELLAQFDAAFDVTLPVGQLTPAERTIVAIARALDGWTSPEGLLILDEPTAALHRDEVGRLFTAVRRVAQRGAGVVFVSHRLDEVLELADRVVVLRDGSVVADTPAADLDHGGLVRQIVGAALTEAAQRGHKPAGALALSVSGLVGGSVGGLDLEARAGEIVGVCGILGSGREHVAPLLFGALPRLAGEVVIAGTPLAGGDPRAAISAGAAFVPGDRRADGAVMTMRARENLTLADLRRLRRRFAWLDTGAERRETAEWVERVGLRPADAERPLELYSGGNQQKVVLAKWLRNRPKVLLLDEPTQGVDVGAKAAIYQLIQDAAAGGAAVVMASSDSAELASICDRVVVLRDGVASAEIPRADLTEERIVVASLGLASNHPSPEGELTYG